MEKIIISPETIQVAKNALKQGEIVSLQLLPAGKESTVEIAISPNQQDLIPLDQLVHEGKYYYLGLPHSK